MWSGWYTIIRHFLSRKIKFNFLLKFWYTFILGLRIYCSRVKSERLTSAVLSTINNLKLNKYQKRMKKTLLFSAALLLAASTMSAAVPEGNLYLEGLNGVTAQEESNLFVLGERDDDDIDEGLWRWSISNVEVTETTGTLTVVGPDGFTLGFDSDNEFGVTNNLTNLQGMLYLAEGGPAINYDLKAGEYKVLLSVFEDIEGDMGGDTWMIQFVSLSKEDDESFYLIGFNGIESPSATARFVKNVVEEDGETSTMYTLPKYHISECPDGFTVMDAGNGISYGLSADFAAMAPEVTDESPMAFLAPDGENVVSKLTPGYYDVNFAPTGAINMISFILCEDQTSNNELEYYLVGLNGVSGLDDTNKFTRNVDSYEYEDEDTGEMVSETTISYALTTEIKENCQLTIVSADEKVVYGYNSDMEAYMPNLISGEVGFAMLAANGPAINCELNPGKYTINFSLATDNTGMLSIMSAEDGAVNEISIDTDIAPIYYNLQGQRVKNPAKGIYIEKRGSKVTKVIR